MTLKELEKKLTSEDLLQVFDKGSWKKYIGLKENRNFSYEQSYGIEKLEDVFMEQILYLQEIIIQQRLIEM